MGAEGHFLNKAQRADLGSYIRNEYERGDYYEKVLDIAKRGAVYYLLLQGKDGSVSISVVLTHKRRASKYDYESEVVFKFLSESMGPRETDAPLKWLDRLTPTDSQWANEYRASVRQRHERKAAERKAPKEDKLGYFRLRTPVQIAGGCEYSHVLIPERVKGKPAIFYPVRQRSIEDCYITPNTFTDYFQEVGGSDAEMIYQVLDYMPVKLGTKLFAYFAPVKMELTPLTEVPAKSSWHYKGPGILAATTATV